jgi:ssDNA-binding Zn-finger/Zn-ribbon topoisomerase 1
MQKFQCLACDWVGPLSEAKRHPGFQPDYITSHDQCPKCGGELMLYQDPGGKFYKGNDPLT